MRKLQKIAGVICFVMLIACFGLVLVAIWAESNKAADTAALCFVSAFFLGAFAMFPVLK